MRAVDSGVEPSGVVWHPRLNRLLVVSDDGDIFLLTVDGYGPSRLPIGGDLEGICIADPNTNLIYVAREGANSIVEVNVYLTGGVQRIPRVFDLRGTVGSSGSEGIESLTFVSDPNHPEGGLFYVGMQGDGRIYVFDLPIRSSAASTTVNHIMTITPVAGRTDLAGLLYLPETGFVYALFDDANLVRVMRPDGSFVDEWFVPGASQEGIAVGAGYLFIAEDRGQLWRYPLSTDLAIHLPDSPGVPGDRSTFISPISADRACTSFTIRANQPIRLLDAEITTTGGIGPSTLDMTLGRAYLYYDIELDTPLPQQEWATVMMTVQNNVGVVTDWCLRLAHLPCDSNGDGTVGLADASAFVAAYRAVSPNVGRVDIDGDGAVTGDDATRWIANFQGDAGLPAALGTFLPTMPTCP